MTYNGPPTRDEFGVNLLLGLLLGAAGAGGLLWLAGGISAFVSGNGWPSGVPPVAGVAAFASPGDPSKAWGRPVGAWWLYWAVAVLLLAIGAAVVVAVWRWLRPQLGTAGRRAGSPAGLPGLATKPEVKAAAGPKALLRRAGTLRPSLPDPAPRDVGFRLGASRGVACWASVEDSAILLGPPRSGKGLHTVIGMILDAPGAVVTTSTRPDNLTATMIARSANGRPVAVFDPQGLAAGVPSATKWSPVRGCEDPQTAMIRAIAMTTDAGEGVENGSFWTQQASTVVRCLLHAAALGRRPTVELYQWSLSPVAAKDAVDILKSNPHATPSWGRALEAIVSSDPRQRDSVWSMVSNTFAALADPAVLASLSPESWEAFDPAAFLQSKGTLYLLGTASGASATAGIVAAFVEDVVEAARRIAAASPGARLDPPLALVLDEAANYPLPSLPSLMSEGGGTGISTLVVLQSLAQARGQWGRENAEAIWDSAIVKIILGGSGNADDLRDLSALIGTRAERRMSVSYGGSGGRSYSESVEEKPILEPGQLRTLKFGYGLLLLRTAAPIMMRMTRWVDRPDAAGLKASKNDLERRILAANEARRARHA